MNPMEFQNEEEAILAEEWSGAEIDEKHHAMMNGPRIQQSLPSEYLEALLKASKQLSAHKQIEL